MLSSFWVTFFFFVSPFLDCLLMSFWLLCFIYEFYIYIRFCHLPILAFLRKMLVAY